VCHVAAVGLYVHCGGTVGIGFTIDGCNGEGATSISCDSAASLVSSFTHLDTQSLNYYGCILIPHFPHCHTLCPNTHMRA
jgi:hypothetical protein